MQDYTKALQEYEKSTQLDGSFLFAKIQSAVAYYRMGDIAKSNTMFQKMVQEFPMSADIRYYYGEILLDQRDIENSILEFNEATKLNPSFALPLLNRVFLFFFYL